MINYGLSCVVECLKRFNFLNELIDNLIIDPTRPLTNYKLLDDIILALARVRATAMEGSFRTQKEHYDLRMVKARTKRTEILYVFSCIHTANVVRLVDRIEQRVRWTAA